MRRNIPDLLIVVFFLFFLLAVPVYWTLRADSASGLSWLEGRQLAGFNSLVHRGFFTSLKAFSQGEFDQSRAVIQEQLIERSFQDDLEAVLSDQFPGRQTFIRSAKAVDRGVIFLAYAFLPDPAIPADRTTGYFIMRDRSAILDGPERYQKSTLEVIDRRIQNYQDLIDQNPEIHFYVYYIERIQNVPAHPLNTQFQNLERGRYYDYFLKQKPRSLAVEKLDILSYEDHLAYFYRTDHHWNMRGVFHAYDEIYRLLKSNYDQMPAELAYQDYLTEKFIDFRGSLARKTFFPISEPFNIVDYTLPPHEVYENGRLTTYSSSADYLAGNYPQDPYYNHYEGEFGRDWPLVEFVFPGNPDQNLLVIGNSYDNALIPLLASHYRHTYDIDLRYYKDFSMSAFLVEHPVDDVLVIGENSIVLSSDNYLIQP